MRGDPNISLGSRTPERFSEAASVTMQFNQLFAMFEPCDGETAQALDLFPIAHDARALDDASLIGETLENFSLSVDLID